jgi:hypothetical protein
MSAPSRACGSCSLCCKVLGILELDKPAGEWCPHFRAGSGCSIHGEHPASCRAFRCLWLLSPAMPEGVRPDRCKVVLTLEDGDAKIIARADPADPMAWRREPIHGQLRRWAAQYWFKGRSVWAVAGRRTWLIAPDREVDLGEMDPHLYTTWEQTPDGAITVTVLPPLTEGETYRPAAIRAALDAGKGKRIVSRRP